jgi:hypothetical protein
MREGKRACERGKNPPTAYRKDLKKGLAFVSREMGGASRVASGLSRVAEAIEKGKIARS